MSANKIMRIGPPLFLLVIWNINRHKQSLLPAIRSTCWICTAWLYIQSVLEWRAKGTLNFITDGCIYLRIYWRWHVLIDLSCVYVRDGYYKRKILRTNHIWTIDFLFSIAHHNFWNMTRFTLLSGCMNVKKDWPKPQRVTRYKGILGKGQGEIGYKIQSKLFCVFFEISCKFLVWNYILTFRLHTTQQPELLL
jgi:hypothetical protein